MTDAATDYHATIREANPMTSTITRVGSRLAMSARSGRWEGVVVSHHQGLVRVRHDACGIFEVIFCVVDAQWYLDQGGPSNRVLTAIDLGKAA